MKIKAGGGEAVKVVVRLRPPSSKEFSEGREVIVTIDKPLAQVHVAAPDGEPKSFTFDHVYDVATLQVLIANSAPRLCRLRQLSPLRVAA